MTRSYGKIKSSLVQSRKFRALIAEDRPRLLYLYLHICQHGNNVGCFTLPIGYVTADMGWPEDAVLKAIDRLCETGLIAFNPAENIVRIVNFVQEDPPTNPKHAAAMFKTIGELPDCPEKLQCLQEFRACKFTDAIAGLDEMIDSLSIGYRNPTPLPKPTPIPDREDSLSGGADRGEETALVDDAAEAAGEDDDLLAIPPSMHRDGEKQRYAEAFQRLWDNWRCHKTPKGSKKEAAEEWERHVVKAGLDADWILTQAEAYFDQCKATDTSTAHVCRWIKKHRWDDDHDLGGVGGRSAVMEAIDGIPDA